MTDIEICGLALGFLGTPGITSFDDDSDEARVCKAFYGPARDALLEDRVWTFATKRVTLVAAADAPEFGYGYKFLIPGNVARVHRVDSGDGDGRLEWVREGQFILADLAPVYATVVSKETDTSLYSPTFCLALAAKLASLICSALTENRSLLADMVTLAEKMLKDAAGADGSQGRSERIRPADSITLRR